MTDHHKIKWHHIFSMTAVILISFTMSQTSRADAMTQTRNISSEILPNPELTDKIARGAKLWSITCNKCHNYFAPNNFSKNQWKSLMLHMRIKSGINQQEMLDILEFLQAGTK